MGKHAGVRLMRGTGVRLRPDELGPVWDAFLGHLATMSAIEASKQSGMPSAVAFNKRRRRDPVFATRVDAIMASRRLNNSGRKRIAPEAWERFLASLPSVSVNKLVEEEGMPSLAAVYQRRRRDPSFRAKLNAIVHDARREREHRVAAALRLAAHWRDPEFVRKTVEALRSWRSRMPSKVPGAVKSPRRRHTRLPATPVGEVFNAQLMANELYAAAASAVPLWLDPSNRSDVTADLVLAVLEGDILIQDLPAAGKEYARRHSRLFGNSKTVSLDAPLKSGSTLTLLDTISAPADCPHAYA